MINWQELDDLCASLNCTIQHKEPMRNHTTFRIGGNCGAFLEINSIETLQQVLCLCQKQQISFTVIGNGSNILATDSGYDGAILHLGRMFSKIRQEGNRLICQAGATLFKIGHFALEASLTGMEPLSGIPGTVGGGLYMNAGAYGGEMSHVTVLAKYMCLDGTVAEISRNEMQLGYRQSIFRENNWIILEVTLQLESGSYGEIKKEMDTLSGRRRAKQPLELPSAGSTFKRPVESYASFLIDQCGLKGASVGDAQVSLKHAGFVVNTGKATCKDVLELCKYVRETVLEKTGYALELEVELLGD